MADVAILSIICEVEIVMTSREEKMETVVISLMKAYKFPTCNFLRFIKPFLNLHQDLKEK